MKNDNDFTDDTLEILSRLQEYDIQEAKMKQEEESAYIIF